MNKYVPNYVLAQQGARELCAGATTAREKYERITSYADRMFVYDYVKAATVAKQKGVYPDPITCWTTHRGICQDIASVVTIMLRAVGVRSYMCVGHAGNAYHAWVQAYAGSRVYRYDHDKPAGKDIKYRIEKVY